MNLSDILIPPYYFFFFSIFSLDLHTSYSTHTTVSLNFFNIAITFSTIPQEFSLLVSCTTISRPRWYIKSNIIVLCATWSLYTLPFTIPLNLVPTKVVRFIKSTCCIYLYYVHSYLKKVFVSYSTHNAKKNCMWFHFFHGHPKILRNLLFHPIFAVQIIRCCSLFTFIH